MNLYSSTELSTWNGVFSKLRMKSKTIKINVFDRTKVIVCVSIDSFIVIWTLFASLGFPEPGNLLCLLTTEICEIRLVYLSNNARYRWPQISGVEAE